MPISFLTDEPEQIDSLQMTDLPQYVGTDFTAGLPSAKGRLNCIKMIYDVLGYDLTNDIALAGIDESQSLLVLSTAGGGKTTWSQIKAIMHKMYVPSRNNPNVKMKGNKILCLVYNRHNVQDMKDKHQKMVTKLMSAGIQNLNIDTEINACTLHSFCDSWRREYTVQMGMVGYTLLADYEAEKIMESAVKIVFKQRGINYKPGGVSVAKLCQFYVLTKECMQPASFFVNKDQFKDLGLSIDVVEDVLKRYEANKRVRNRYDFIDMLENFYKLICENEKILKEIQKYYEYVIADEVQDFTPLMWAILEKLVSNGTQLTAIGDEDQSIYAFRGADIYATLDFKKRFANSRILTLSTNRRCREAILNVARNVVAGNKLRFNKDMKGVKPDGEVKCISYSSTEGEIMNIIGQVKKLNEYEQSDTVICYRNTASSMLLTEMLVQYDVPFHCYSGMKPFSHELYKHLMDIFTLLEMPYDRFAMLNLYKVTPISKQLLYDILDYDAERHKFRSQDPFKHFADYDYKQAMQYNNFAQIILNLKVLSDNIEKAPLKDILKVVFEYLKTYFWTYKKQQNDSEYDNMMEKRIVGSFSNGQLVGGYFCSSMTWPVFIKKHNQTVSILESNDTARAGVTVSTFHSLKGLEFSKVYVIDMDDNIFPDFGLLESRKYAADYESELKEAETRLWYVTVTRAKDSLYIYYPETNPSIYVKPLLGNQTLLVASGLSTSNIFSALVVEPPKPETVNVTEVLESTETMIENEEANSFADEPSAEHSGIDLPEESLEEVKDLFSSTEDKIKISVEKTYMQNILNMLGK